MTASSVQRRLLNGLFYYVHRLNKIRVKRTIKSGADLGTVFGDIHRLGYWQGGVYGESVSGTGSHQDENAGYAAAVIELMEARGLARIFDCSCGDLNWAVDLLAAPGIDYHGGDIVPALVERNRAAHDLDADHMRVFDLTETPFLDVDLWHCKDTLFHLSFENIRRVLENFAASTVPFALITTQTTPPEQLNGDIQNGQYRPLDLTRAPISLPPPEVTIPNGTHGGIPKHSGLWTRETIAAVVRNN
ncbi:MAG: class I SAM-dependent methyltransferase [Pseudomonadota bacterium]